MKFTNSQKHDNNRRKKNVGKFLDHPASNGGF